MTKILRIILSAILPLIALSGCSEYDSTANAPFGHLTLSVSADPELKTPSGFPVTGVSVTHPNDVKVTMSDVQGSFSRSWDSLVQFPEDEQYFAGTYRITAGYGDPLTEGFNLPYYYGETVAQVSNGNTTDVTLQLALMSGVADVAFTPDAVSAFNGIAARIVTEHGGYFDFPAGDGNLLYFQPGSLKLYLTMTLDDGSEVDFQAASVEAAQAGVFYMFDVDIDSSSAVPVVRVTVGNDVSETRLTDEFLAMTPPSITTGGWESGVEMTLPEGDTPSEPVIASVVCASGLSHLYLSINSVSLRDAGLPLQVDLMNLSAWQKDEFERHGLKITVGADAYDIDFTDMLSELIFLNTDNALSTFILMAEDASGRVSAPAVLKVRTTPVEIEILSVEKSIVGLNVGAINVRSSAPGFSQHVGIELQSADDRWEKVPVSEITRVSESVYRVTFPLPDGSGPIEARVIYCDEVRADVTIERVMPEFTIEVDAFANFGVVKIVTSDESMRGIITDNVTVYANDQKGSVLSRYPDKGLVTIIGLKPSTVYRFRATMMSSPDDDDFTREVTVRTESTPQLPNSDFEERNDGVRYSDLPSGGRYSQTTVEIFNWQNHTSFSQQVPKSWANTNPKTFCRAAKNYNTWYMQPSVFTVNDIQSGDFAVTLRSVAFDTDGAPIPDYAQTGEPYLDYSLNIPRIAHRAAGKLFLGDYSFDASTGTETYREGISWNSRPVSLNGFYKYSPSEDNWNDRGLVVVEVMGERDGNEIVIASGRRILPLATGYTAFNVPLEYEWFGIKASRIKVMFASSESIGTIAEETASIITHADPRTATSLGSQLWLDNVTLAY